MQESTIRRIFENKKLILYGEMIPFATLLGDNDCMQNISGPAAKERIKQLIAEEDQAHPLSDQSIEKIFKSEGIIIARRILAKYREELGISSSVHRKIVK